MLDGFDEINFECQLNIICLMKALSNGKTKLDRLIITTRPHLTEKLQKALFQLAFSLEHLGKEHQVNYLTNYWQKKTNVGNEKELIKKFANSLVEQVSEALKDEERTFIGIPLRNNIAQLYQMLFSKKRDIFRKEKATGSSDSDLIVNWPMDEFLPTIDAYVQTTDVQNASQNVFPKMKEVDLDEQHCIYGSDYHRPFVDRIGLSNKKSQTEIEADTLKYNRRKDAKYVYYKAMAKGRRQDFEELVNNLTSESLNSVDSQSYTLLEWATVFSTSDWPIDQFLIEKGAEIQTDENLFRQNVFFIALQYLPSNKESRHLSFDGIDIHDVNQTGDTALHLALYGQKWDVAEKILDQFPDYDVNVTNSKGYTPLHLAVHPKCKMVLIEKILARMNSESVNTQDERGWTALHDAIRNQSEIAVKELLKRDDVDVNLKNNNNVIALHYACFWKNMPIELFTKILEKSADVNAQGENGDTALHWAIRQENRTAVEELLKCKDVDVNLKNNDDRTALHSACAWKNIPIDLFRVIIGKLADINAQEEDGWTALHDAIDNQSEIAVKELLKRDDVDVNLKDNNNVTALHYAAGWKNIPGNLLTKILEKSADVNAQDKDGWTTLHYAIKGENRTAVEELLKRDNVDFNLKNNQNQTALHSALLLQSETFSKLLLDQGADVNIVTEDDSTPLHLAVQWPGCPEELLGRILNSTKNLHAKNQGGKTALHCALESQSSIACKMLLKKKENDVDIATADGEIALHLAAKWPDIGDELFTTLLGKTTEINKLDSKGRTPLHCALFFKSVTATKILLNKDATVDAEAPLAAVVG
jgi:E3 ubiquitin-protein ligase mind-bomb